MSHRIKVEREVLVWARERSGRTVAELSESFKDYESWEIGEGRPTLNQLEDLARKTRTPLGSFFLNKAPEDKLPIPDYRTKSGERPRRPGPDLLETLATMQQRRAWLSEHLREGESAKPAFIGSISLPQIRDEDAVIDGAARMKTVLGFGHDWARDAGNLDDALRMLRRAIESVGVIVSISGVVGLNNTRKLSVDEFRGFALVDEYAPLIFVNGTDASAAKVFTLVHEFAHLFLGKEGVSAPNAAGTEGDSDVEFACNRLAAEFLVPKERLVELWRGVTGAPTEIFKTLGTRFRVSPIVVGRRAMELGLVSRDVFFAFHAEYKDAWLEKEPIQKKKTGGSFYTTVEVRLGHRFAAAVFAAAKSGELLYRDAYRLTGLSGPSFERLSKSYELGYSR